MAPCTPASAPAGRCAERCGSYVTSFEQVEGDCGKRPEQLAHLSGNPSVAPAPCRGSFSATADNCITQFDIHCPMKDASGTTLASIERGSLSWVSDASRAGGNLELWLTGADTAVRCHSQYVVSIQRQ